MVRVEGLGHEGGQRLGNKQATVALARKMAVVMHRMWVDGTTFRFSTVEAPATAAA